MTNTKWHMGFSLTPRSMTLDDLELWVWIFREFLGISQTSDATTAKRMKIDQYCHRQRCKHIEMEQFCHVFASHGFVSASWAILFCCYFCDQCHVMTICPGVWWWQCKAAVQWSRSSVVCWCTVEHSLSAEHKLCTTCMHSVQLSVFYQLLFLIIFI